MAPPEYSPKKRPVYMPKTSSDEGDSKARKLREYNELLQAQLREEREEKEALSLERAKLKVCWEMTLEELASTKTELTEKITTLENELQKQMKRKRVLQNLLREYGNNMEDMKKVIENILIERPNIKCNIKY